MDDAPSRYDDWKAPAEDGSILIWPAADRFVSEARDNQRLLDASGGVRIQNTPLPELRREMRQWTGHRDPDQLLIATGHQTELYHPGVWAKIAVIDAAARASDGRAVFFAVDTDAPKHLSIRWPGRAIPISDDPRLASAAWSGQLETGSPTHLKHLRGEYDRADEEWDFSPELGGFLDSLRRIGLEHVGLSSVLTNACHLLDWELGLRHDSMLVSPLLSAGPFLQMVHHLCARADTVARNYNQSLEAFRLQQGITNPGRPMPDLRHDRNATESPFWLDDLTDGHRERLTLLQIDRVWTLTRSDSAFAFDPQSPGPDAAARLIAWLNAQHLRIAPRALTLTMFLRLLVADTFVHGIGGGRYDQVLDGFIHRMFGIDPPRFAVATATLVFPAAAGSERVCVPCLKHEGHQLRHRVLGNAKDALVEAIARAPRRSFERAGLFSRLHTRLAEHASDPSITAWADRYRRAEQMLVEQRGLFDRELFYPIQPRDRLAGLIDRCRSHFPA